MTASFARAHARPRLLIAVLLGAASLALGCDDPPAPVDGGVEIDAFVEDASRIPDAARLCTTDDECDDGVECTREVCDPLGFCRNQPDVASCDDGNFCNGVELCDARRGCIPGARQTCNDGEVCTIDRCNETTQACDHFPRDLDEDGDPDFFCEGGGDCDDRDPLRSSAVSEICDDGLDNDCDDAIDEATCGRPPYDTCDNPLDVSSGGVFIVNTRGATPDYLVSCAGPPVYNQTRPDLVLTFTIEEADAPRDVIIEAEGDFFFTALSLRSDCTAATPDLACRSDFPSTISRRALGAGTYYVVVHGSTGGEIAVDVQIREPAPLPTNETCATPIDVSDGGTFMGSMLGSTDDVTTGCGVTNAPDLLYVLTTTAPHDVRISATTTSGESMAWELRPTCAASAGALRCTYGDPASGTLHELAAGTYYLALEGPSHTPVDFSLVVEILPPTPPPAGDVCATAIPLTLGTPTTGSLMAMEDDLDVSCGFNYRDIIYSFTLPTRRDLTIDIDGGTFMNASLRPATCADDSMQLRCANGNPVRMRLRDVPAGTYYLVVEASRAVSFTLTVADSAPSTVVAVSGNDTCGTAHVVPAAGGVFTGTTVGLADDVRSSTCGGLAQSPDAVFQLDLAARSRVVASTEGSSYDTVLHMHTTMCRTGAENACDDDGGEGSTSLLDRTLDPGTHFFVVDGFGMVSSGAYVFEVLVTPTP